MVKHFLFLKTFIIFNYMHVILDVFKMLGASTLITFVLRFGFFAFIARANKNKILLHHIKRCDHFNTFKNLTATIFYLTLTNYLVS